jgi:phosphoserine phosphatase
MNPNNQPEQNFAPGLNYRGIEVPQRLSDFRLIAFDMDST